MSAAGGPIVLVTTVGAAAGARAAATALACAAPEADGAALLIDLTDARPPRPSLIATAGARKLEERLTAHMPDAAVASRGRFCRLTLPANPSGIEQLPAALPLVHESAAVVHLPPRSLRSALEDSRIWPTAALLRADLSRDRALTALAVRELIDAGLRVGVLKQPLPWLAARAALLGALPNAGGVLPKRLPDRLLWTEDNKIRYCYDVERMKLRMIHGRMAGSAGEPPRRKRQFVPRDELLAAFKGAPTIDLEELRAESDAYIDPSAWCWDDWEAWLIDTSVAIALATIDRDSLPAEVAVSTLTFAEMVVGPHGATHDLARARREHQLRYVRAKVEPLDFDLRCALAYGPVYGAVLRKGRKPRGARAIDLMIAATALAHNLPLHTKNAKDLCGLEHLIEIVEVDA